jgi:hypothetical protein
MIGMFVPFPNSYAEILTPKIMVLGGGAVGKLCVNKYKEAHLFLPVLRTWQEGEKLPCPSPPFSSHLLLSSCHTATTSRQSGGRLFSSCIFCVSLSLVCASLSHL